MADNVTLNPGTGGPLVAADEVSYSGDTANVTLVRVVSVTGAEGSKTVGASDAMSFLSRIPANGQAAMAASMPVSIASDQTPVPMQPSLGTASGNITTQNASPNGVATAGSAVEIVLNGAASVSVQTTGVYTGALSVQVTSDGTRWETITGAIIVNALSGVGAATIASAAVGIFTVPVHGALRARVTGLSAMTGAAAVTLRALAAPTAVYAFQPTAANMLAQVSGTVGVTGYPTAAASADALANPTVTQLAALGLQFNGTSWDRGRNNHNVAVETSSAKTASGNGTTQTNFNAAGVILWGNVTAVTGTTPTLTVRVQWSPDGGTNWIDLDTTNAQTASIAATGAFVLRIYPGVTTAANAALNSPLPRTWRLAWTVGGTTPSFTFLVQAAYIN